jgi:hypothetical protein
LAFQDVSNKIKIPKILTIIWVKVCGDVIGKEQ